MIVGISLATLVLWGCFPSSEDVTTRRIQKIYFESLDENIYLKRIESGLNFEASVISTSPQKKFQPNYDDEYVFSSGTASFFYKKSNDTLFIKAYILAKEPGKFPSTIKVFQTKLDQEELKAFKEIYKQEGYSFFGSDDTPFIPPTAPHQ